MGCDHRVHCWRVSDSRSPLLVAHSHGWMGGRSEVGGMLKDSMEWPVFMNCVKCFSPIALTRGLLLFDLVFFWLLWGCWGWVAVDIEMSNLLGKGE